MNNTPKWRISEKILCLDTESYTKEISRSLTSKNSQGDVIYRQKHDTNRQKTSINLTLVARFRLVISEKAAVKNLYEYLIQEPPPASHLSMFQELLVCAPTSIKLSIYYRLSLVMLKIID